MLPRTPYILASPLPTAPRGPVPASAKGAGGPGDRVHEEGQVVSGAGGIVPRGGCERQVTGPEPRLRDSPERYPRRRVRALRPALAPAGASASGTGASASSRRASQE